MSIKKKPVSYQSFTYHMSMVWVTMILLLFVLAFFVGQYWVQIVVITSIIAPIFAARTAGLRYRKYAQQVPSNALSWKISLRFAFITFLFDLFGFFVFILFPIWFTVGLAEEIVAASDVAPKSLDIYQAIPQISFWQMTLLMIFVFLLTWVIIRFVFQLSAR